MTLRSFKYLRATTLALGLSTAALTAGATLPALAQTAPANAAAPAADPARLALAQKLLDVNGTRAQTEQGLKDIMPLIEMALTNQPGMEELTAEEKAKLTEYMGEAFQAIVPEILNRYAGHFANSLTEAELNTLITFYGTDTGKKFVAAQIEANKVLEKEIEALGAEAGIRAATKFIEWKLRKDA
ncbi:DUF2059 domain-containing protein [Asticcacaulis tiandongensis]|uniref:DUF2059 domain-containing protein n=1 Tax=Asticcacaulis tiandongensis TaxID=2565365 RepID=UPI0015E86051|nr:DUF2059 domain-containing protein [Asticcacaulis tiandongensis]